MYKDDCTQDKVIYGRRTDQGDWRYVVMSLEEDEKARHYVELDEWAEAHGTTATAVRHRCRAGRMPGAFRYGKRWLVPEDTTWTDRRFGHSEEDT